METQDITEVGREARLAGVSREEVRKWYALMHLARVLDDKAPNYLKQGLGWSYHAPSRRARRDPARPGHDVPARPRLPLPLLSRPDDLRGGRPLGRGDSPERDVQGDRRGLRRPPHVQPLRQDLDRHPERLLLPCPTTRSTPRGWLARSRRIGGTRSSSARSASPRPPRATSTRRSTARRARSCRSSSWSRTTGTGSPCPRSDQTANLYASDNFAGFQNLKIIHCDGLDVFDSFRAMREAVAFARSGAGAAMVHATCVRIHSHSNSDRQDLYRTPEELAAAAAADPLPRFRKLLLDTGLLTEDDLRSIETQNEKAYDEAADRAKAAPEPDPATIHDFVSPEPWTPERWPEGIPDGTGDEMTFVQALNATLKDEFRRNPDTYIWGQDVAYRDKGGVFNVTKGMQQEFGLAARLQRPHRRGLHHGHGRRLLALLRRDPGRRRGRGVRRLLLAGRRADGGDVARVLADQRPVRPERHRAPGLRRLHRRRPLPLPEHRGLADDAAGHPRRRPGLRRRRGGPAAHRDPLARHHALPRAQVPLQQPDGDARRCRPSSRCPSARRACGARART